MFETAAVNLQISLKYPSAKIGNLGTYKAVSRNLSVEIHKLGKKPTRSLVISNSSLVNLMALQLEVGRRRNLAK